MTVTCSGCDKPIEFTGTLTERHTVIYCERCMRTAVGSEASARKCPICGVPLTPSEGGWCVYCLRESAAAEAAYRRVGVVPPAR